MTKVNETSKYWDNESNCAQAVACGILEHYDMHEHIDLIHSSMTGFGGGMGERSICGAVTGGLAALGIIMMKRGINAEKRGEIFKRYKLAFVTDFDTLNCKDILAEFILPDGTLERDRPERREKCSNAVETAAKIVKEIIDEL